MEEKVARVGRPLFSQHTYSLGPIASVTLEFAIKKRVLETFHL